MVAAAYAYVNALNKLLVKRQKTAPEALVAMTRRVTVQRPDGGLAEAAVRR